MSKSSILIHNNKPEEKEIKKAFHSQKLQKCLAINLTKE
jgi:hypothetical protein